MKVIEYVYENHFNSPDFIGTGINQFKDKEELINWIPTHFCPTYFIEDFQFYQPIKKGTDCAVANKSGKLRKKICTECWEREYLKQLVDLTDKEKEVYKIANNALYFNDRSDYITALYETLKVLNPNFDPYAELKYIE
jgi:hypothetical protein